jgi:hypothetical protein
VTRASVQLESHNPKLSPQQKLEGRFESLGPRVASTYVSTEATCPRGCPWRGSGCYAEEGQAYNGLRALNDGATESEGSSALAEEAAALRRAWPGGVPQDGRRGGRDLRLHVGGDVDSAAGAALLAGAVAELKERGLGAAWSYTHRWAEVPRESWGSVHVLASVHGAEEVERARARGYAAADTVQAFRRGRRAFAHAGGVAVPCPWQTGGRRRPTCAECRLCLGGVDLVRERITIAFVPHGRSERKARLALFQLPLFSG